MVEGVSLNILATCGKNRLYGSSSPSWKEPFKPFKKSQITTVNDRKWVWNQSFQRLLLTDDSYSSRHRDFKVEAKWKFGGGEQGLNASVERSESANEGILIFFFQLDLATRVQVWLFLVFTVRIS